MILNSTFSLFDTKRQNCRVSMHVNKGFYSRCLRDMQALTYLLGTDETESGSSLILIGFLVE